MIKTSALIPASGEGRRLGLGPKAFLKLGSRTILEQTINCFYGEVDEIIVAVSKEMFARAKEFENGLVKVIIGGSSRQATVYKLIQASRAELVLIHDAARPFLAKRYIQKSIDSLKNNQAVIVVKAVADSLIAKKGQANIDRESLWAVQTPQSFRREVILKAHEYASKNNIAATDDAALVRLLGIDIALIEADSWLDKITNFADYERAKALLEVWHVD